MMWKNIFGFEGIYKISEYGDILNIISNKILSPYINNKGYKMIDLNKNGTRYRYLIHRLVAIHFVPNPYNLPIVLHKDNVKLNIHYSNLKWGTYSENNAQSIRDGLNFVPIPDNRKYYEIYGENERVFCFGANEVLNKLEYGSDSVVRNLLHRHDTISKGPYKGYKVRKTQIICPIIFLDENLELDKRSTISP